jgi:hypothetical protein
MKHSARALHFFDDFDGLQTGGAVVDNRRETGMVGELEHTFKQHNLFVDVSLAAINIETDFADGNDGRIAAHGLDPEQVLFGDFAHFRWMHPNRASDDTGELRAEIQALLGGITIDGDRDNFFHAGLLCAGNDLGQVVFEIGVVEMAVGVDHGRVRFLRLAAS